MPARLRIPFAFALALLLAPACGGDGGDASGAEDEAPETSARSDPPSVEALERVSEAASDEAVQRQRAATLDREFPLHGLVTRPQLTIRTEPDPEAPVIGWLRWGERIRLKDQRTPTATCATGWYPVAPSGWACAGQGIEVAEAPPTSDEAPPPAERDAPLPYHYYFVTQPMTPQYHQPPSRSVQRQALSFGEAYVAMLERNEARAERLLEAGEFPGGLTRPAAVARYLHRGFFVAAAGVVTREQRRFVRATGGGYVKESRLEERSGSDFEGVVIDESHPLPQAWVRRTTPPRFHGVRYDGTHVFSRDLESAPLERQTLITDLWVERENIDDHVYHRLEGGEGWDEPRYARDWFLGVAERIEPPFEVEEGEPWVHVDLSEQTLVVYRGAQPVYATLVSSGLEGHDTPTGTFRIQRKMVTDTMANLGPDAGDDSYRVQDVPWTQYFDGSFALHGAFWHHRFGLMRSHGCVNLSPADAHRVFQETWPRVPEGWHGVHVENGGFRASRVHVTE